MNKESLFPNWFKNVLFVIAAWTLVKEFARPIEIISNSIIVLCYPILLTIISLFVKSKKIKLGKGKYFFNISIFLVSFFVIIILTQYRSYIEFVGRLIGGNFSITTDYSNMDYDEYGRPYAPDKVLSGDSKNDFLYYCSYLIYGLTLIYFCICSWHLSKRIKRLIDKDTAEEDEKFRAMISNLNEL